MPNIFYTQVSEKNDPELSEILLDENVYRNPNETRFALGRWTVWIVQGILMMVTLTLTPAAYSVGYGRGQLEAFPHLPSHGQSTWSLPST